jgi:hypothetical protein
MKNDIYLAFACQFPIFQFCIRKSWKLFEPRVNFIYVATIYPLSDSRAVIIRVCGTDLYVCIYRVTFFLPCFIIPDKQETAQRVCDSSFICGK